MALWNFVKKITNLYKILNDDVQINRPNTNFMQVNKHIFELVGFHAPTSEKPDWFYYLRRVFLYITITITTYALFIGLPFMVLIQTHSLIDVCKHVTEYLILTAEAMKVYMALQQTKFENICSSLNKIYRYECWDETQSNLLKKTNLFLNRFTIIFTLLFFINFVAMHITKIPYPNTNLLEIYKSKQLMGLPLDTSNTDTLLFKCQVVVLVIHEGCFLFSYLTFDSIIINMCVHLWVHLRVLRRKLEMTNNNKVLYFNPTKMKDISTTRSKFNCNKTTSYSRNINTNVFRKSSVLRADVSSKCNELIIKKSNANFKYKYKYERFTEITKVRYGGTSNIVVTSERNAKTVKERKRELNKVLEHCQKRKVTKNLSHQEAEGRLRHCVQLHQDLLRLKCEFESLLNAMFSMLLVTYLLLTCCVALLLMQDSSLYRAGELLVVISGELFVTCCMSEVVNKGFSDVKDAVYDCDWTGASESFKRSVRIMISRANQDNYIKVAGFVPYSMATFYSLTKTSYSYLTVLLSLNK